MEQDRHIQFFDNFRNKFYARLGSFNEFNQLHDFNTEIMQFFVDKRDWQGVLSFYHTVMEKFIKYPPTRQQEKFMKDIDDFIPDFHKDTKKSFQHAFDFAEQNNNVKAIFYCFEHRNIDGIGRCTLRLCCEYDPNSLDWVTKKISKGHPRFKLPKMTVDEYDYLDIKTMGKEYVHISELFTMYLNNRVTLVICMLLDEITKRKIPVGIIEAGESSEAHYISYI